LVFLAHNTGAHNCRWLSLAARHIQVQVIEEPKHSRMIATEASDKTKISPFFQFFTEKCPHSPFPPATNLHKLNNIT